MAAIQLSVDVFFYGRTHQAKFSLQFPIRLSVSSLRFPVCSFQLPAAELAAGYSNKHLPFLQNGICRLGLGLGEKVGCGS